jgi:hypothetical protein
MAFHISVITFVDRQYNIMSKYIILCTKIDLLH